VNRGLFEKERAASLCPGRRPAADRQIIDKPHNRDGGQGMNQTAADMHGKANKPWHSQNPADYPKHN
jgi:hypothetical protein